MNTKQLQFLNSVDAWVDYIQTLHVREIDLSLSRVASVYKRMYPEGVSFKVITVAGTNGKGSTTEMLFSIYHHAGYKAAKFTSPHITRFNERFKIAESDVEDEKLLEAFRRVEYHRDDVKLTYFEYGILLAIELFENAEVQIAIIEVGLGGRLDASNILDTDLAIVTSLSIDHVAWLGNTLEEIGREKIGIARPDAPCVLGMSKPPQSVVDHCQSLGISPLLFQRDFEVAYGGSPDEHWQWRGGDQVISNLPLPFSQAGHQLTNAAVAIQSVRCLEDSFHVSNESIINGLRAAKLNGRCQIVNTFPHIVLDVAHNVDSIQGLVRFVEELNIGGNIYAVCGMLADKQIEESLSQMSDLVDSWHIATIDNVRAAKASDIQHMWLQSLPSKREDSASDNYESDTQDDFQSSIYASVVDAFHTARGELQSDDCLIVFGSFFVVSDIIGLIDT